MASVIAACSRMHVAGAQLRHTSPAVRSQCLSARQISITSMMLYAWVSVLYLSQICGSLCSSNGEPRRECSQQR